MPPVDAQAPIEMHHFGCGICCQMRRSTGASLKGTRPAQINTSAWRGEKDMRSMPKRARSNCAAAVAMKTSISPKPKNEVEPAGQAPEARSGPVQERREK